MEVTTAPSDDKSKPSYSQDDEPFDSMDDLFYEFSGDGMKPMVTDRMTTLLLSPPAPTEPPTIPPTTTAGLEETTGALIGTSPLVLEPSTLYQMN